MLISQIALDGDGYIFRSALAIFGFLEPRYVVIMLRTYTPLIPDYIFQTRTK
jgi:hypothetical protein